MFAAFGPEPELQLYGRGLRRRLPTMVGGDERRMRMLYSLAFSLPGTPVLFYGEEIGMAENLEIPGRYSVRAPMQWSSERHGGFSTSTTAAAVPAGGRRRGVGAGAGERRGAAAHRRIVPELDGAADPPPPRVPRARLGARAPCSTPATPRCSPIAPTGTGARSSPSTRSPTRGSRCGSQLEPEIEEAVDLLDHGASRAGRGRRRDDPAGPYGYRWFRLRRDGQRVAP